MKKFMIVCLMLVLMAGVSLADGEHSFNLNVDDSELVQTQQKIINDVQGFVCDEYCHGVILDLTEFETD